jgi:hypothetical protein
LLCSGSAVRGKGVKHLENLWIAGDDPGMQKRIPMNGILFSKFAEERIRIRHDLGIEQVV